MDELRRLFNETFPELQMRETLRIAADARRIIAMEFSEHDFSCPLAYVYGEEEAEEMAWGHAVENAFMIAFDAEVQRRYWRLTGEPMGCHLALTPVARDIAADLIHELLACPQPEILLLTEATS